MNMHSPQLSDELMDWLQNFNDEQKHGVIGGVVVFDAESNDYPIVFANSSFIRLAGYNEQEVIGASLFSYQMPSENQAKLQEIQGKISKTNHPFMTKMYIITKENNIVQCEVTFRPLQFDGNAKTLYMATFYNITEQTKNEMLYDIYRRTMQSYNQDKDPRIILSDICKTIEQQYTPSDIACSLILYDEDDTAQKILSEKFSQKIIDAWNKIEMSTCISYLKKALKKNSTYTIENVLTEPYSYLLNDDRTHYDKAILIAIHDEQKLMGTFMIAYSQNLVLEKIDVSFFQQLFVVIKAVDKYNRQQKKSWRYIYRDPNTGLYSLEYFKRKIQEKISECPKGYISIISPKEYDDIVNIYGRKAGYALLTQIANRMASLKANENDIIASFVTNALIIYTSESSERFNCYKKIKSLVESPYIIENSEIYITISVGVCPIDDDHSLEECIRHADQAFSKSMEKPGDHIQLFNDEENDRIYRQRKIYNQIIYGLKEKEFRAYLQPKLSLQTKKIIGFEALARWQIHDGNMIYPDEFIPVAEHTGKIIEIEDMILEEVLKWLFNRKYLNLPLYQVAVNASPQHFYKKDFVDNLVAKLRQYQIDPCYIKIEITENIGLADFKKASTIISCLKLHGFETSMDDFGKGFSSLNYLTELAFAEIKIDKSFIDHIDHPKTFAIIRTIVQLANNLNINTVAEGIEYKEQSDILSDIGCDVGQGYHFYKPMTMDQANQLLNELG